MGSAMRTMWYDSPAVTKALCAAYPLLSALVPLAARRVPSLQVSLLCCLFTVLRRGYVWTIFLSFLYRPIHHVLSLVMVLVEVYLSLAYLPEKELELGSTRFLVWLLLTTSVVNASFLFAMALLSYTVNPQYWLSYNQGLCPLLMVCITLRSLASPREPAAVLGIVYVPSRWYPVVLGAVLSTLSGGVLWDVTAALAVGYFYTSLQLDRLLPSVARAEWLERGWLCGLLKHSISRLGVWVPPGPAPEIAGHRFASLAELRSARRGTPSLLRAMSVGGDSRLSEAPVFHGDSSPGRYREADGTDAERHLA